MNLLALAALVSLSLISARAAAQWYPSEPVKLVIMAGKGGGADKMARMFAKIIEDEGLSPVPFEPVNMAGGSGGEALTFLKQNNGNPHVVMVTLNSFYTTPLTQPDLDIDISKFTPIARMAEDIFMLWVARDSGITSLEQFLELAKDQGTNWVMAGTGKSGEDNLLTNLMNHEFGLRMEYRAFKGGGDVARELVERKANSTVNNPSEQDDFYREGKSVPIAAFTPERLEQYPDVPTFAEKGRDLAYFMQRSIVGPPGMDPEAGEFYSQLFQAVYESKEWQDYMNSNSLRGEFATGDGLMQYWMHGSEVHRKMLIEMKASN